MHLINKNWASKTSNIYAAIVHAFGINNFYDCSVVVERDDPDSNNFVIEKVLKNFERQSKHGGCLDDYS